MIDAADGGGRDGPDSDAWAGALQHDYAIDAGSAAPQQRPDHFHPPHHHDVS